MTKNFLNMSTPAAIGILILCIVIENKFSEVFKANREGKRIRVRIDLNDWKHSLFLITAIGVILFTPGLNLVISILYSFFILYRVYIYYRK